MDRADYCPRPRCASVGDDKLVMHAIRVGALDSEYFVDVCDACATEATAQGFDVRPLVKP